jgi:proteic killer suppression protein
VEIDSIRHKALRRLVEKGSARGVIEAERVIDMIAFLVSSSSLDELSVPPNFGFHPLTGDRKGSYAMTVTKNWRLTFTMVDDSTIADLDLEDYH